MTNREKYSEEIMEILFNTGIHPALINEQIAECHKECRHCKFAHTKILVMKPLYIGLKVLASQERLIGTRFL